MKNVRAILIIAICSAYNITVSNTTQPGFDFRWYRVPSHLGTPMGWNLEHPVFLYIPIDPISDSAVIVYDTSPGPQYITNPQITSTKHYIILEMSWWGAGLSVGLAFKYPMLKK